MSSIKQLALVFALFLVAEVSSLPTTLGKKQADDATNLSDAAVMEQWSVALSECEKTDSETELLQERQRSLTAEVVSVATKRAQLAGDLAKLLFKLPIDQRTKLIQAYTTKLVTRAQERAERLKLEAKGLQEQQKTPDVLNTQTAAGPPPAQQQGAQQQVGGNAQA